MIKKMKKVSTIFYLASALLLCAIGVFSSCSQEDKALLRMADIEKQMSFTASATNLSAATKSGSNTSNTTILHSDYLGNYQGEALYLNATESEWPLELDGNNASAFSTKASVITTANITNNSIGVMVYSHAANAAPTAWDLHSGLVEAEYVTAAGKWVPKTTIYWPNSGSKNAHFFAYAPYNTTAIPTSSVTATAQAIPTIAFTVNSDYTKQVDLVAAEAEEKDNPTFENICQGLTFNHTLTGIRFKVASGVTVKKITISGVNSTGTLTLGAPETTMAWSGVGTPETFIINEASGNLILKSGESGDYISLDDKYTLMMLPTITDAGQPAGAKITITFDDDKEIEGSISGHRWERGKMITYLIARNISEIGYTYTFNVTNPTDIYYSGLPSESGRVVSYRSNDGGVTKVPVKWRVAGFYKSQAGAENQIASERYQGIGATFLKSFSPMVGNGSSTDDGEQIRIIHPAAEPSSLSNKVFGETENARINSAPAVGSPSAYHNLACPTAPNSNNITESANSYIINAEGYYRIPLVMGNGVKNNAVNTSSWSANGYGHMNYMDERIISPYLHKSSASVGTPTRAILLWEDWDFIEIKNVDGDDSRSAYPGRAIEAHTLTTPDESSMGITRTGTNESDYVYWLNFHAKRGSDGKMKQGVAHIAIFDENNITMWSYLIWLTDYKPKSATPDPDVLVYTDPDNNNTFSGTRMFMPRNLGWVEAGQRTITEYDAASVYVSIVQEGNPTSQVIKLERPAAKITNGTIGYCPFYQTARMIPLLPGSGNMDYPESQTMKGFAKFISSTRTSTAGESIKAAYKYDETYNPTYFSINGIKQIFDPSPAGYQVPGLEAKVFALSEERYQNDALTFYSNTDLEYDGFITVYTAPRKTFTDPTTGMGTIRFPITGHRGLSDGLIMETSGTHLRTAAANGGGNFAFYYLLESNEQIVQPSRTNASRGFCLRPVRE